MTTIAEVTRWLEEAAPLALAESWDNVGLLMGDPAKGCRRIMTCLTITRDVAVEAVEQSADLVVSHHPVLFQPTRRLRADLTATAPVWTLASAGIAVYSAHTAFDNAREGINELLAHQLELAGVGPLVERPEPPSFKVVVFVPRSDRQAVMDAAFQAGAGQIGDYAECSFATPGYGTFLGGDSTHPTIGTKGQRERVREWRLEFVCPTTRLSATLAAIRAVHSYEEPAIDVYPLHPGPRAPGAGRIGELPAAVRLDALTRQVGTRLDSPHTAFVGDPGRLVQRVAIACGAGDDYIPIAAQRGADVLLTGEVRYHKALEALALGLSLVVPGHHASERPGMEDLARRIAQRFPSIQAWTSDREQDPFAFAVSL